MELSKIKFKKETFGASKLNSVFESLKMELNIFKVIRKYLACSRI